jgi:hypothetical protein
VGGPNSDEGIDTVYSRDIQYVLCDFNPYFDQLYFHVICVTYIGPVSSSSDNIIGPMVYTVYKQHSPSPVTFGMESKY